MGVSVPVISWSLDLTCILYKDIPQRIVNLHMKEYQQSLV